MSGKKSIRNSPNRHLHICPCKEHIKTQTRYYAPLLKKLGSGSEKYRATALQKSDPCFIRYLGKCAKGILDTNIKLTKRNYSDLAESKQLLLTLANPSSKLYSKRKALIRHSGGGFFLPILANLAASTIGPLVVEKLSSWIHGQ